MDKPHTNGRLKRGDIVINTFASPNFNDLHIVMHKGKYVHTQMLFKGKLVHSESKFSTYYENLVKIGHLDIDGIIIKAMTEARAEHEGTQEV